MEVFYDVNSDTLQSEATHAHGRTRIADLLVITYENDEDAFDALIDALDSVPAPDVYARADLLDAYILGDAYLWGGALTLDGHAYNIDVAEHGALAVAYDDCEQ